MSKQFKAKNLWLTCIILVFAAGIPAHAEESVQSDSLLDVVQQLSDRVRFLENRLNQFDDSAERAYTSSLSDSLDFENMIASRGLSYFPPNKKTKEDAATSAPALLLKPEQSDVFEDAGLEFSGFLDGVWEKSTTSSERGQAFLHQVELDLAHEINERTAIEVAIAYGDAFEVGAATIQYTFWDREATDNRSPTSGAVAVGQFDVPVGLDFEEYASIDRKLITGPLAVDEIHGSWNDVGAVSAFRLGAASMDAWLVQGFEGRMWNSDESIPEDIADDDERWLDTTPEVSGGFRMNYEFAESFSSGFSLARGWLLKHPTMSLAGFHSQAAVEPIEFKGELLYGRRNEAVSPEEHWGFYAQLLASFGRYSLIGRYDQYQLGGEIPSAFVSTGAGIEIATGLEYRTEYRFDMNGADNRIYLQIVAGF